MKFHYTNPPKLSKNHNNNTVDQPIIISAGLPKLTHIPAKLTMLLSIRNKEPAQIKNSIKLIIYSPI